MDYKQKLLMTLGKVGNATKVVFATTLTLAFGATMIWGVKDLVYGNENQIFANEDDGSIVNICGTSPASANWNQHDANSACQGCTRNGSCTGNVVRVFTCESGEETSGIECRAHGKIVGTSASFDNVFEDECLMYQIDVFSDTSWNSLQDFVVWKGKYFGNDEKCNPQPTCPVDQVLAGVRQLDTDNWSSEITIKQGTNFSFAGFEDSYSNYLTESDKYVLEITEPGATVPNTTDNTNPDAIVGGAKIGTYTIKAYIKGFEKDSHCVGTAKVNVEKNAEPQISCVAKTANSEIIKEEKDVIYTVTIKVENGPVDKLTFTDDYDETKMELPEYPETGNPWDCSAENGILTCTTNAQYGIINSGNHTASYRLIAKETTQTVTANNTVTKVTAVKGTESYTWTNTSGSNICKATVKIEDATKPSWRCDNKTVNVTSNALPGQELQYTIQYSATGLEGEERVEISDLIPAGTKYVPNSVSISTTGTIQNCNLTADMNNSYIYCQANKSGTITFKVKINNDFTGSEITNIATASLFGAESVCPIAKTTLAKPTVDCVSKKVSETTNVKIGDTVTYTINYNSTNQTSATVKVTDTLDKSKFDVIGFIGDSVNYCTESDNTITCNVPSNKTGSVSFYAKVLAAGTLTNTANVSDNTKNDSCSVDLPVRELKEGLVCTEKEASNSNVNKGDYIDFTINYRNSGEKDLTGFRLVDQLPTGMEYVGSENNACKLLKGIVATGQMIECINKGTIKAGKEDKFVVKVKITNDAKVGSKLTNVVTKLTSGTVEGNVKACSKDVYVNMPQPKVSINKEVVSPADRTLVLGDDAETMEDYVVYKIIVTNNGPTKLVTVPLKDTFSSLDYQFISASLKETNIVNQNSTTVIYWENIGAIEVGASKTITVTLKALETYYDDVNKNVLPNYAKVEDVIDENGVKANEANDQDMITIIGSILGEELEFSISKTLVTENPTKEGREVKFHIVITNTGEKEISTIKFVDDYDVNFLTFSDFSSVINHNANLYRNDSTNAIFTHDNLLDGKASLKPNEKLEFDIWFIAKNKDGVTINYADATVEDVTQKANDDVEIDVEILAKTGANIMIPLAIGASLVAFGTGVVIKKKRED